MELYLFETATRKEDAYAVLAYAARQYWGFDTLPAIGRQQQGKPYFPDHPNCHFNLSHSGPSALCAVDDCPVGADIEVIRPHHLKLAQRICSKTELDYFESQSDKDTALCKLWTEKEALVKYHGIGLTIPLRDISATLPPAPHLYSFITAQYCLCVCGHSMPKQINFLTHEEISP